MKKGLLLGILVLLLFIPSVFASPCTVYFFYSPTCPHCVNEKPFLAELEQEYPELNVEYLIAADNFELFESMSKQYDTLAVGVPRTFVDDKVFVGFSEEDGELEYKQGYMGYVGYKNQIEKAILESLNVTVAECEPEPEPISYEGYLILPLALLGLYFVFFLVFRRKIKKRYLIGAFFATLIVIFFYLAQYMPKQNIIGFAKQFSFPMFTFILALLDGFNPCAFAVLAILLSLLTYAKSRGKMALIGIIFIITSGVMYFLFIIILLALRTEILGAYKDIIRIVVGCIALVAGAINLKDFFFFKKGISLTISEDKMGGFTRKMKHIVDEVREARTPMAMFIAIISTIVLAALVNLVELGCTLILPVEYIEVLITNYSMELSAVHIAYTAFYCLVYVIPLFAILGSFLYTFKSERMTEMKGRVLKLIGGLVMVGLGLIMIFLPELLVFG